MALMSHSFCGQGAEAQQEDLKSGETEFEAMCRSLSQKGRQIQGAE